MFALPGIIALIVLILLRPQEFIPALEVLPTLHLALLAAVVGYAVDVLGNITKVRATPVTVWGACFLGWAMFTLALSAPSELIDQGNRLVICVVFGFVVAHGVTTPRGLSVVANTVLFCAVVLAAVGVHQGLSPKQCLVAEETGWVAHDGKPDGRLCTDRLSCYEQGGGEPDATYLCEHVGLWGTTSIGDGRVRYRGVLKDPNELALAIGIALPIAYASRREHGGIIRFLIAVLATVTVIVCTVLTESRGGQLVILAVLGTYFVVRTGFRGVILAAALAVPALAYGGRSGSVASSSTTERIECWYAGIDMFLTHPLFGVGYSRFTEHHYLTAHNTYILSLAEMGPIGLWLFISMMYAAMRVPFVALQRYKHPDDPRRAWAVGVLAALSGLCVGVFFLSFSYNHVLWLFVGLAGAFYGVLKSADAGFDMPWRSRDTTVTVATTAAVMVTLYVYTRLAM